jgi:hypothetical protein
LVGMRKFLLSCGVCKSTWKLSTSSIWPLHLRWVEVSVALTSPSPAFAFHLSASLAAPRLPNSRDRQPFPRSADRPSGHYGMGLLLNVVGLFCIRVVLSLGPFLPTSTPRWPLTLSSCSPNPLSLPPGDPSAFPDGRGKQAHSSPRSTELSVMRIFRPCTGDFFLIRSL